MDGHFRFRDVIDAKVPRLLLLCSVTVYLQVALKLGQLIEDG